MKSFLIHILAGFLFSFPILSPASNTVVLPNLQVDYLFHLQTSEEYSRTVGASGDNSYPEDAVLLFATHGGYDTQQSQFRSTDQHTQFHAYSIVSKLIDLGCRYPRFQGFSDSHSTFLNLLSHRSVVLQV